MILKHNWPRLAEWERQYMHPRFTEEECMREYTEEVLYQPILRSYRRWVLEGMQCQVWDCFRKAVSFVSIELGPHDASRNRYLALCTRHAEQYAKIQHDYGGACMDVSDDAFVRMENVSAIYYDVRTGEKCYVDGGFDLGEWYEYDSKDDADDDWGEWEHAGSHRE